MNKRLTFLLCLAAFIVLFPLSTLAVNQEGDYDYNVSNGEAVITRYYGSGGNVTIPSELGGYPVTIIGIDAFNGRTGLTSVTIPNSVTSIGQSAFYSCTSLTSVTIPNSVTSIGANAFDHCTSLTSVTIPNSVTSIGANAFAYCTGLTSVTIPNSITSISNSVFNYCTGLISVTIPNSVTSIGNYAFYNTGLRSVSIPNSVTSIGDSAFYNTNLTSVTIPDSMTSIGNQVFSHCPILKSVTIPNSVTSIGNYAFADCTGLTSVTIPNSVTNIGMYAFQSCTSLKNMTIPNSVTSIGNCTFQYCYNLTSVTIPNSVTNIGSYAFDGCTHLTLTVAPDSYALQYATDNRIPYQISGKPTITTQPANISVNAGETATFKVVASGMELTYQWYYQKPEESTWNQVSVNGTAATYSLTTAAQHNGYQYCCQVTNSAGTVTSSVATLTVETVTKPTITTQPTDISVNAGETATFKVVASGTELTYQWYYQKPGESTWNKVSSNGTAATYSLTTAARHNGYTYRCHVTNSAGSVYSDTATLTVATPVKITAQPQSVTVAKAEDIAKTTVTASGDGLTYQWYVKDPGSSSFSKSSNTTKSYSVALTAAKSGRQVYCAVTDQYGNTVQSNTATLSILSKPTITTQPKSVSVAEGKTATFKVVASGTGLSYQWYYQKPGESAWTAVSVNGTAATYSLTTAARHNGYTYRCKVTNTAGSVTSSTATLTVVSKPTISTQPKSVSVSEGQKATFKVVASSGGLTYQWYYKKPGESTWNKVSVNGTAATYSLTAAARHNGYKYRCKVTNAAGSVYSSTVTLTVAAGVKITAQPKSVTVAKAGDMARTTVTATGDGLTYQWYVKDPGSSSFTKSSNTTKTYSVALTEAKSGRQVYCVVGDKYGNTVKSSTATLTIE